MSVLNYTPLDEIPKIHNELQKTFLSKKMTPIAYRKYQLLQLAYLIKDNQNRLEDALRADLARPGFESQFLEIVASIPDVLDAYKNVEKWTKPEKPPFSLSFGFSKPVIYKEAKGVVLIIVPFNYPVWLALGPLAGALAAGNTVVLKPSELSSATSALWAELFPKYLDPSVVRVVNGAIPETTKLLELPWGHIMYTGSGRVGRIVAAAAAKTLTPISLELGGKSPVFIDSNCDIKTTARRLLWGKAVNAGQTCVAPDYVLVPRSFQDTLVKELKAAYESFYPESTSAPNAFARMITPQAYSRVNNLLISTKGTIVLGGEKDEQSKFIGLTVVKDVPLDDSLMSEEIFGPILPIVPVKDVDEAIDYVNAHDHPLSLYVFSQDDKYKKKILHNTQSGAFVCNETLLHLGVPGLPFGGIGPSGSGSSTGKFSFDMFTHLRASMDQPSWLDMLLGARYPPYTEKNLKSLVSFLPTKLPPRPKGPPAVRSPGKRNWWLLAVLIAFVSAGLTRLRKVKQ